MLQAGAAHDCARARWDLVGVGIGASALKEEAASLPRSVAFPGKPRAMQLVSEGSQSPHSPPHCGGRQPEPGPCSPQGGLCSGRHATHPALHRSCGCELSERGCTRGPSPQWAPAPSPRPETSGVCNPTSKHWLPARQAWASTSALPSASRAARAHCHPQAASSPATWECRHSAFKSQGFYGDEMTCGM